MTQALMSSGADERALAQSSLSRASPGLKRWSYWTRSSPRGTRPKPRRADSRIWRALPSWGFIRMQVRASFSISAMGDSRASSVRVSTDDDTRNQLGWQLVAWQSTRLRDDRVSKLAQAVSRSFLARTFPTSVFAPRSLKIVSASSRAATAFSRTPFRWYIVPSPYKVRARS